MLKQLFSTRISERSSSWALLFIRLVFGALFLHHGLEKLSNFDVLSTKFPDPIGLGSAISLSLAIFAEVACAVGFISGFLFRLSVLPMIVTMCIAVFVHHAQDALAVKEVAILYLTVFAIALWVGPGRYSIDHLIFKKLK